MCFLIQRTPTIDNSSTVAAMMSTITTADTPPMMATVSLAITALSVCRGVMIDGKAGPIVSVKTIHDSFSYNVNLMKNYVVSYLL